MIVCKDVFRNSFYWRVLNLDMKKINLRQLKLLLTSEVVSNASLKKILFTFLVTFFCVYAMYESNDYNLGGLILAVIISPLCALILLSVHIFFDVALNWQSLWEAVLIFITGYYTWFRLNISIYYVFSAFIFLSILIIIGCLIFVLD